MLVSLFALVAAGTLDTHTLDIPQHYQAPTVVLLRTVNSQKDIDNLCRKAPKGYVTMGCYQYDTQEIILPNPCLVNEASNPDSYAHLLCHEIGHAEGWHHDNE